MFNSRFESLSDLRAAFSTEQSCIDYLEERRWHGNVVSPFDKTSKVYKCKDNKYRCKNTGKYFDVKTKTIFQGTRIPLISWFEAIWTILSYKKGISSVQLGENIKVSQKTAWFMLHRIRHNIKDDDATFDDMTQMDETYMGGKSRNHGNGTQGRSLKEKTPIFGMVSDGLVYAQVVPNVQKTTLYPIIKERVREGSTIITDELNVYNALGKDYKHKTIPHKQHIYALNGFHTNSIEGFWSHIKRGIKGIYHLASKKHLSKYCKEFVFRYNTRKQTDGERFNDFLGGFTERLYYGELLMKPEWAWESN